MAKVLARNADFRIERNEDSSVSVHVRADKIPNRHGYGHTIENGNTTRTYGRMMARKYLTPAQGERIELSPAVNAYRIGTDVWREYIVKGNS